MSDLDNKTEYKDNLEVKSCLNCDASVQEDFLYCAKCSQRLRTSKISVGSLLSEFVSSMFNFDSRFFQSFLKLFMPGTLSKEYISGRRKRYLNPARFFLFSMIFHFAVLGYVTKEANDEFSSLDSELNQFAAEAKVLHNYDSLIAILPIDTIGLDTLRSALFRESIKETGDSIVLGDGGLITVEGIGGPGKYAINDIVEMEEEEFLDHYKVEGKFRRILTRQLLRMSREPQAMFTFFIGNLLWAVVLSIVFLSFILKLLYIRSKRFFVEHLILLMHIHSFIFILVGIGMLIDMLSSSPDKIWLPLTGMVALIYFFISMYRYYDQGIFKTFFKYVFVLFAYLFIIVIFAVIILLISLLIF